MAPPIIYITKKKRENSLISKDQLTQLNKIPATTYWLPDVVVIIALRRKKEEETEQVLNYSAPDQHAQSILLVLII